MMICLKIALWTDLLLLSVGNLLLSFVAGGIIRQWIYSVIFFGFSTTRIRKIRSKQSTIERLLMVTYYQQSIQKKARRRIIVYWGYCAAAILCSLLLLLSKESSLIWKLSGGIFFTLRIVDILFLIDWVYNRHKKIH